MLVSDGGILKTLSHRQMQRANKRALKVTAKKEKQSKKFINKSDITPKSILKSPQNSENHSTSIIDTGSKTEIVGNSLVQNDEFKSAFNGTQFQSHKKSKKQKINSFVVNSFEINDNNKQSNEKKLLKNKTNGFKETPCVNYEVDHSKDMSVVNGLSKRGKKRKTSERDSSQAGNLVFQHTCNIS